METKLNIAKILKDKPVNTRLYSPIFGNCILGFPKDMIIIDKSGETRYFYDDGRFFVTGECLLFPSKEMQDWSKFAWKRGDVLVDDDKNVHIIFEGFDDDTYISFKGKHYLWEEGNEEDYSKEEANMATSLFEKANYESAQAYINAIEEKLGGKLNLETLEIEKTQPEFKNGDIAYADYGNKQVVFIVSGKTDISEGYNSFIALDLKGILDMGRRMSFFKKDLCKLCPATDSEKQQLFDALAKENKAWDAEKKEIVDLKPKWTPKTFDRVITRDFDDGVWSANIFSHMNSQGEYVSIGCVEGYAYCLPYNEETAKLIGTTNNAK